MCAELLKQLMVTALVGCVLPACTQAEPSDQQRLAVLGGEQTGQERASVVYVAAEVRTLGGNPVSKLGSGTLVAPNLMLTALHVISTNPSDVPFTCDATGHEVSGSDGALLGPPVSPAKIRIYAGPQPGDEPLAVGARVVSSGSETICQNDIAFVVLDRPLDLPTVAIRRATPAQVGDPLIAVGFGGDGTEPIVSRTERDVQVTAVGQWIRTFTVSEGPCEGDSGGPALTPEGELAGVFSSVAMGCGPSAAPKYTDVSYFGRLVEQAFAAAGAPPPWQASGSAGAAGAAGEPSAGAAGADSAGPRDSEGDSSCAVRRRPIGASVGGWMLLFALGAGLGARRVGSRR